MFQNIVQWQDTSTNKPTFSLKIDSTYDNELLAIKEHLLVKKTTLRALKENFDITHV
jgi:hypothetical protein